jgi:Integrase core domain
VTPVRAPQANAHAERWIRTVRTECLDWLLITGRGHLEQVLRIYVERYNNPHGFRSTCARWHQRSWPRVRRGSPPAARCRVLRSGCGYRCGRSGYGTGNVSQSHGSLAPQLGVASAHLGFVIEVPVLASRMVSQAAQLGLQPLGVLPASSAAGRFDQRPELLAGHRRPAAPSLTAARSSMRSRRGERGDHLIIGPWTSIRRATSARLFSHSL